MNTVTAYAAHAFLLLTILPTYNLQAAQPAEPHRCTGSYALSPTQEALRKKLADVVCARAGCACETHTDLNKELCQLLSRNTVLTETELLPLARIVKENPATLLAQAPGCKSSIFHLLISGRRTFGCLHKDGAYLKDNIINIISMLLINRPTGPLYSRRVLFGQLDTRFRNSKDIADAVPELKHVAKYIKEQLEHAVLDSYWREYNAQKAQRDQKRAQQAQALDHQTKIALV